MGWRCTACGRSYDEPPEACACGSASLTPDDGAEDGVRFAPAAIRQRLLDPQNAERSLVREEPHVTLVFRFFLAIAVLGLIALVAVLLLT